MDHDLIDKAGDELILIVAGNMPNCPKITRALLSTNMMEALSLLIGTKTAEISVTIFVPFSLTRMKAVFSSNVGLKERSVWYSFFKNFAGAYPGKVLI